MITVEILEKENRKHQRKLTKTKGGSSKRLTKFHIPQRHKKNKKCRNKQSLFSSETIRPTLSKLFNFTQRICPTQATKNDLPLLQEMIVTHPTLYAPLGHYFLYADQAYTCVPHPHLPPVFAVTVGYFQILKTSILSVS